jgi:hypothetical protein
VTDDAAVLYTPDLVDAESETEIGAEPAPEVVATHFLSTVDDVVEHLRAAVTLGFGVRLRSYLDRDPDGAEMDVESWELDLLTSSPVRTGDDEN